MEGYECGRVFLKTKEWKKELREEKLVENIGQVMQMEVRNMVGGMLRE